MAPVVKSGVFHSVTPGRRPLVRSTEVVRPGPRPPPEVSSAEAWTGTAYVRITCVARSLRDAGGRASALALLVAQVVADDHDPTVTADHLALVADLLDARLDLHGMSGSPGQCHHRAEAR